MKEVSLLSKELRKHLLWHQARITFIAQFILALLRSRSCNLTRIADEFQTPTKTGSSYRRIKRFFSDYPVSYRQASQLILDWMKLKTYALCMDRTNWTFGKKHINYLVVSVVYQNISIPIVWKCLTKSGGNSNTEERIELIQRVLEVISPEQIEVLLCDREFIGKAWFNWLIEQQICFRVRIKKDTLIHQKNGQKIPAWRLFTHVGLNSQSTLRKQRTVFGLELYLAASRSYRGLLMVVTHSRPLHMLDDYAKRWQIETLFGCLKSRGFELESTHLSAPEKMDKLMMLLAITVLWCISIGEWHYGDAKGLPLNRHMRPEQSLFRLGMDMLRRVLLNADARFDPIDFIMLLKVLSRT